MVKFGCFGGTPILGHLNLRTGKDERLKEAQTKCSFFSLQCRLNWSKLGTTNLTQTPVTPGAALQNFLTGWHYAMDVRDQNPVVLIWEQRCVPWCKAVIAALSGNRLYISLTAADQKVNVSHGKFSRDHCKHTACGDASFLLHLIQPKVDRKAECFMGSCYSNTSHIMVFKELPAMNQLVCPKSACSTGRKRPLGPWRTWPATRCFRQHMKDRSATRMATDLLIPVCMLWTQFKGLEHT